MHTHMHIRNWSMVFPDRRNQNTEKKMPCHCDRTHWLCVCMNAYIFPSVVACFSVFCAVKYRYWQKRHWRADLRRASKIGRGFFHIFSLFFFVCWLYTWTYKKKKLNVACIITGAMCVCFMFCLFVAVCSRFVQVLGAHSAITFLLV